MRLGNRRRNEEERKLLMKDEESQIELSIPVNVCRECPPLSAESYDEDTPLFRRQDIAQLTFRSILPCDRQVIETLHEEWFPVSYQSEFYDELVQGRMVHSGEPLYTNLATTSGNTIVGCVIGSMVKALILSKVTQELLVDDVARYPRLFYIMTLGTLPHYRRSGLATHMIQDCLAQAQNDVGCGTVYLHVLINNVAAIAMYEKLGFYRVQEIANYYWINDELHNCYLYAKYFHGE